MKITEKRSVQSVLSNAHTHKRNHAIQRVSTLIYYLFSKALASTSLPSQTFPLHFGSFFSEKWPIIFSLLISPLNVGGHGHSQIPHQHGLFRIFWYLKWRRKKYSFGFHVRISCWTTGTCFNCPDGRPPSLSLLKKVNWGVLASAVLQLLIATSTIQHLNCRFIYRFKHHPALDWVVILLLHISLTIVSILSKCPPSFTLPIKPSVVLSLCFFEWKANWI